MGPKLKKKKINSITSILFIKLCQNYINYKLSSARGFARVAYMLF